MVALAVEAMTQHALLILASVLLTVAVACVVGGLILPASMATGAALAAGAAAREMEG